VIIAYERGKNGYYYSTIPKKMMFTGKHEVDRD